MRQTLARFIICVMRRPVFVEGNGRGLVPPGLPLLPGVANDPFPVLRRSVVLLQGQIRVVAVVAAAVVDVAALLVARRRLQVLVNPAQAHFPASLFGYYSVRVIRAGFRLFAPRDPERLNAAARFIRVPTRRH